MEEALSVTEKKPHAVCVPLPFQSHINAMLKLAKILHFKGFHITFVNTEFNHQRILASRGPDSLKGLSHFRFETIPDGLPPSDINATQDMFALTDSIFKTAAAEVSNLIAKLNDESTSSADPPVSCIISDLALTCLLDAAKEFAIPHLLLWPMSAAAWMGSFHSQQMVENGLFQLKDKSCLTKGYLETPVDFIPGLTDFRLKDIWSFFWEGMDELRKIVYQAKLRASEASAVIINTFDALENKVLEAVKTLLPATYTIGPLHFLEQQITDQQLISFGSNLLEEHEDCLQWLNSKPPNSVIYVNFGSTTVMTQEQLVEFAWGLANSRHNFLWVIRPDLVKGGAEVLPSDFIAETANRGMISGWCPQEKVLGHTSIGGFLTHCGWNSVMDAVCAGVPVISWPFLADQPANCRDACVHWGIGMEIDSVFTREDVVGTVRELMEGEKGKDMKRMSVEWKKKAEEATKPGGSSYLNLNKIVEEVLVQKKLDLSRCQPCS